MYIKGENYNFGRRVYFTIGKISGDPYDYTGFTSEKLIDPVTICFDPRNIPQCNTRIDFWVRHQYGKISALTGSSCSIAAIDIYNIGPALEQFINAYNCSENNGEWKTKKITKYVCALQVGYDNSPLYTIFAGVINSYNVERQQTQKNVETIWHFYCAGTGGKGQTNWFPLAGEDIAVSGKFYTQDLVTQNKCEVYENAASFLRNAIMKVPRFVYSFNNTSKIVSQESFSVAPEQVSSFRVPLPIAGVITEKNFDKYFKIRYSAYNTGAEDWELRYIWENTGIPLMLNLDYSDLETTVSEIAKVKNCKASIQTEPNTGLIIINIYSPSTENKNTQKRSDFVVKDFQNMIKPPVVSGKLIQFTFLLEPSLRAHDTVELQLTEGFSSVHQMPSFGVNFEGQMSNWATVFAGANFEGIANVEQNQKNKKAMTKKGNIFNKKYKAIFVMHQGSTHENEWSTTVDCSATEVKG